MPHTLTHHRGHLLEGKWNYYSLGHRDVSPTSHLRGDSMRILFHASYSQAPSLFLICHVEKKENGSLGEDSHKTCDNTYLKVIWGSLMFRYYDNTRWTL